jgi:hypothetical protein
MTNATTNMVPPTTCQRFLAFAVRAIGRTYVIASPAAGGQLGRASLLDAVSGAVNPADDIDQRMRRCPRRDAARPSTARRAQAVPEISALTLRLLKVRRCDDRWNPSGQKCQIR